MKTDDNTLEFEKENICIMWKGSWSAKTSSEREFNSQNSVIVLHVYIIKWAVVTWPVQVLDDLPTPKC